MKRNFYRTRRNEERWKRIQGKATDTEDKQRTSNIMYNRSPHKNKSQSKRILKTVIQKNLSEILKYVQFHTERTHHLSGEINSK